MDEEEEKEKKGREDRDRKVETGVEVLENMRKKLEKRSDVRGVVGWEQGGATTGLHFQHNAQFFQIFQKCGSEKQTSANS